MAGGRALCFSVAMGNRAMKEFWTGDVGARWVRMAPFLDAGFAQVTQMLVTRAEPLSGRSVLDVGCGAGALSRAVACQAKHVTGIDISATMLDAARAQAPANATYLEADAQTDRPPGAPFDAIVSQFGLMFFDDTVSALANLRDACAPGARLTFATWARAEDNPWFHIPRALAVRATGPLDSDPDAPGPMRMRDVPRVERWLRDAGWRDVTGETRALDLIQPGPLDQVAFFATQVGGASSVLAHHQADKATRRAVTAEIAAAFAAYDRSDSVHVPATVNFFTAVA
nr:class I SAM-dependent methyltransferase [Palleronia pontilimi]